MNKPAALLVLSTAPNRTVARRLARAALDAHTAACVTFLPAAESHFTWEGRRQKATEFLLLFKLPPSRYPTLHQLLLTHHPYQCPEILAFPATHGHPPYLDWLLTSTTPTRRPRQKKMQPL